MEVIAFVGPSGTGKSHQALGVAYENGADAMIDDGLLIQGNRIIAGVSAKREANVLQATRRAIFMDPEHIRDVREGLAKINPQRLMVIATSEKMAEKICAALEIPQPVKTIRIEEVVSRDELALAKKMRNKEGKHVIPVPTIEVKRKFSGYWLESLEVFWGRKNKPGVPKIGEKTIIRPKFSYIGKLTISENAIAAVVSHVAGQVPGCRKVNRVDIKMQQDEVKIQAELTVVYGYRIPEVLQQVQAQVEKAVENFTGLAVSQFNVIAKEIALEKGERDELRR